MLNILKRLVLNLFSGMREILSHVVSAVIFLMVFLFVFYYSMELGQKGTFNVGVLLLSTTVAFFGAFIVSGLYLMLSQNNTEYNYKTDTYEAVQVAPKDETEKN